MPSTSGRMRLVAISLMIVGGLLPPGLYWLAAGRAPGVSPQDARQLLTDSPTGAVLVDVRSEEEFSAGHVEAARNWPLDEILALDSATAAPQWAKQKQLLLLCQSGIRSALAARKLRELGVQQVVNVHGGMEAWVASGEKPCALALCRVQTASGDSGGLPFRESPLWEQWVAVLTGFVVKPVYTLMSLVLAVVLWRRPEPDLAALRWAMLCFFTGENFCAANYLAYSEQSTLLEYLHSYGMVLCFGLVTYAVFEGLDQRIIRLSDPDTRCAALGLCRECIKHADVPCGLRRAFQFLIPALIVVALAPLCAELVSVTYNTRILGTFYNYSHRVLYQVFEVRCLPVAGATLLAVSWAVLWFRRRDSLQWSKLFFAAGMGAVGFSFFRLVLFHAYRDSLVWCGAWEEITELLFILGVGLAVWVFRGTLLSRVRRMPGDCSALAG